MSDCRILHGDCRDVLLTLPERSVHCVVTSPPYWMLRDYGVDGQIGLETVHDCLAWAQKEAPCRECFICALRGVFGLIWRVLRDDGVLWVNIGDSYVTGATSARIRDGEATVGAWKSEERKKTPRNGRPGELKPKDMVLIPQRLALALQMDGWYVRRDVIWRKDNPMPESCDDRCTTSHEYVWHFTKRQRYYFDAEAIREPVAGTANERGKGVHPKANPTKAVNGWASGKGVDHSPMAHNDRETKQNASYSSKVVGLVTHRNKRSVWDVTTVPYPEAHFATFPPTLVEPMVLSSCPAAACASCGAPHIRIVEKRSVDRTDLPADHPEYRPNRYDYGKAAHPDGPGIGRTYRLNETKGWEATCECAAGVVPGVVLDPFGGSGTVGAVARKHGRDAVLIELNPEYIGLANKRVDASPLSLFAGVAN